MLVEAIETDGGGSDRPPTTQTTPASIVFGLFAILHISGYGCADRQISEDRHRGLGKPFWRSLEVLDQNLRTPDVLKQPLFERGSV